MALVLVYIGLAVTKAHSNFRAVGEAKYSLCNVVFRKAVQLLHKGFNDVYPQFGERSAQYENIQIGII